MENVFLTTSGALSRNLVLKSFPTTTLSCVRIQLSGDTLTVMTGMEALLRVMVIAVMELFNIVYILTT